jgi:hypothetical protein
MDKVQAIGSPFELRYSSNSNKTPTNFMWSADDHSIKVYIDTAILTGMTHIKKPHEKKIGWVCESRSIFHQGVPRDIWDSKLDEICESYDAIFTSERSYVGKNPKIHFCYAGSNLPWIKNQQIFEKSKMVSLIASPKKYTFGHVLRHATAERFKDSLDLYGGVLGSPRLDPGVSWGDKSGALNDYMFSIVIENDKYETYFTEKLTDAFVTGTIPVYWGAPDIGKVFNMDGIIELTPDFDPKILTRELYESKIEAMADNFERVQNMTSADDILYQLIGQL